MFVRRFCAFVLVADCLLLHCTACGNYTENAWHNTSHWWQDITNKKNDDDDDCARGALAGEPESIIVLSVCVHALYV